jgi:hypothetical protein
MVDGAGPIRGANNRAAAGARRPRRVSAVRSCPALERLCLRARSRRAEIKAIPKLERTRGRHSSAPRGGVCAIQLKWLQLMPDAALTNAALARAPTKLTAARSAAAEPAAALAATTKPASASEPRSHPYHRAERAAALAAGPPSTAEGHRGLPGA